MIALRRSSWTPAALGGAGCVALALRSLAPVSVAATALVGVLGLVVVTSGPRVRAARSTWIAVTITGCAGFAASLALGTAVAPRVLPFSVFAVTLAAVAEEAFFRRFLYGWLERWGPAVAVGVTAVLFGLIHVPIYGWAILPLDVAAGALLGWQRWATGTWTAPLVAHAIANLVVFA